MKKIVSIIFCLFLLSNLHAQYFNYMHNYANIEKYDVIDSAYLKCSYKLTYLKHALNPEVKSEDLQVLLIGKLASKYYSQYALDYKKYIHENYIKL